MVIRIGGKKRSKYGEYIDTHLGYGGQEKLREATGLNRDTISKACNNENYRPKKSVMKLLIEAVKKLTGKNVKSDDFWM